MSRLSAIRAARCCAGLLFIILSSAPAAQVPAAASVRPGAAALGRIASRPLAFEPNRGQFDARVRYAAHAHGESVFITDSGVVVTRAQTAAAAPEQNRDAPLRTGDAGRRIALRLHFPDSRRNARIEASEPLPGRSNYLIGSDRKRWHTNVPHYARIVVRDAYPGIDIAYYDRGGGFEYDLIAAAGADPSRIRLVVDGAERVDLDDSGNLVLHTALGDVIQKPPHVYQGDRDTPLRIEANYRLQAHRGAVEVRFELGAYDRTRALVLDPVLDFASYFGGGDTDNLNGLARDVNGDIYLAGGTASDATAFPVTVGAYQTTKHDYFDAYVAKIKGDGTQLIYSTYIGGRFNDYAKAIAVDADGQAVIGGQTGSDDYPLVGAAQDTICGGTCGMVTKLLADGSDLKFSTYLGGNGTTDPRGIAVDAALATYVTGVSFFNATFPTTPGAFQTVPGGTFDAFAVKYDANGSRVYATLLGEGIEQGNSIVADGKGSAYVVGTTSSTTIHGVPVHRIGPGTIGVLAAKFNATGSGLVYLTSIGGTGGEEGTDGALDASGNLYFTGRSYSSDIPSTPPAPGGTNVALFGELDSIGNALVNLTWYGNATATSGSCSIIGAYGSSIALDEAAQTAWVVGWGCPAEKFPVNNPVAELDCTPNCASTTGSFLLQYKISGSGAPLAAGDGSQSPSGVAQATTFTAASTTPIAAGMGTSTYASGVAQWHGRAALGLDTSGLLTMKMPLYADKESANDSVFEEIGQTGQPPEVAKYFSPVFAEAGQVVTMGLVIANPNKDTQITHFRVDDVFPGCIKALFKKAKQLTFKPPECKSTLDPDVSETAIKIPKDPLHFPVTLAENQTCVIELSFQTLAASPCVNQTKAATSDQGGVDPATASVTSLAAITRTWKGAGQAPPPGGTSVAAPSVAGLMSDTANWVGGVVPADGDDLVFPAAIAQTAVSNDLPVERTFNLVSFTGTGYALSGNAFNLLAGVNNAGASNTFAAAVKANLPLVFTSAPLAATLSLAGGIQLNGNDIYFNGAGATTVGGAISGSGDVSVLGSGDVVIAAAPTFTGAFFALGGRLIANAAVGEAIDAADGGTLRGSGPFGAVTLDDGGSFFPGTSAAPVNVNAASLTINAGTVELGFAANNATHSAIASAGAVAITGGTLKLDLGTLPTVGTVFSNLITAPASISGCFHETAAAPAGVLVAAQCTASVVAASVIATDDLFHSGFGG